MNEYLNYLPMPMEWSAVDWSRTILCSVGFLTALFGFFSCYVSYKTHRAYQRGFDADKDIVQKYLAEKNTELTLKDNDRQSWVDLYDKSIVENDKLKTELKESNKRMDQFKDDVFHLQLSLGNCSQSHKEELERVDNDWKIRLIESGLACYQFNPKTGKSDFVIRGQKELKTEVVHVGDQHDWKHMNDGTSSGI